ncbi:hypothetical protein [Mucilaginibacter antarcticus]|uniref:Lipocalin-like protein n=1 Tax=Mucilaginibacter antarcticus TaxID=1855725 RepID=A0ABW5XS12_9SPHI
MVKSVLPKTQKAVVIFSVVVAAALSFCFCFAADADWLSWANRCLFQSFDATADSKLKKWELSINDESFIRLRKTYQTGKQEYFSFNLQRLEDMEYLGNTNGGTLKLKAKSDDIIVQTYNDKKGNVDTMASELNIPVKNIEPERLDSLKAAFDYFKTKSL